MIAFRLPDLGEGMEEAEIITWHVQAGSDIEVDEPFVDVQTDKAIVEIPSPVKGRIMRIHGEVGDVIQVGSVLAEFEADGPADAIADPAPSPPSTAASDAVRDSAVEQEVADRSGVSSVLAQPSRRRAKAAPAVRKLADELGVDIDTVTGSGDGGRVTSDDVKKAASASSGAGSAPPQPELRRVDPGSPPERIPLRGVQRRMSEVMSDAWKIPHISGMDEFDATELLAARRSLSTESDSTVPITLTALFVQAVAQVLPLYPLINSQLDAAAGELVLHHQVNVGFAVAAPSGLVVPVIRDADRLSLHGIAREIARLTEVSRSGSLRPQDVSGGTFTVTNYGALGRGRFATPIIRPPEVAIIGFGAIAQRPWVHDGAIAIRPVLPWSFSADHRVIDGNTSGAFQRDVVKRLANPYLMLIGAQGS